MTTVSFDAQMVGNKQRSGLRAASMGLGLFLLMTGCGASSSDSMMDGGGGSDQGSGCTLSADTSETSVTSPRGCHVLSRDTSSCKASREAQGLTGYWLKFSCRVTLSKPAGGTAVSAASDGQPDYKSSYFATSNACYEAATGGVQNPNTIALHQATVSFPLTPSQTATRMDGAIVGLALNGVAIFGNFAAPGDDIFLEAMTFDRCGAHPQGMGHYHYHGEPYALSYDDANFIGVLRDGYPVYGRRDPDGSLPTLDTYGGHTGVTVDSPTTAGYHYHVNEQTSTGRNTAGQKQWFLTTGMYRGSVGTCQGC